MLFFIENVHLKNTKEFTFYSNNTERKRKRRNEEGEREILLPQIWGNTVGAPNGPHTQRFDTWVCSRENGSCYGGKKRGSPTISQQGVYQRLATGGGRIPELTGPGDSGFLCETG